MDERRIFGRGDASLPCTLELGLGDDQKFLPPELAQFENLSGGGCSVLCRQTLPEGRRVRLSVHHPEEGELILLGTVRHCVSVPDRQPPLYSIGIEYVGEDRATQDKLFWLGMENDFQP